jgi:uncharacterized protein (DUF1697 family)
MGELRKLLEQAGLQQVTTYINSGNVLFTSDKSTVENCQIIQAVIQENFGITVPVIARTQPQIENLVAQIPDDWTNDAEQKTDILFLWDEIDSPDIMEQIVYKPEIETARYIDGALVWNIQRSRATRGSLIKIVETHFYKKMTVRNVNTVRKIAQLLAEK